MFGFFLILPLMLIIIIGNQLHTRGFYSDSDIAALTKTLYWVILPALLFRSCYKAGLEILKQPNLLVASTVCYMATMLLAFILALVFHGGNKKRIAVSVLSSFRGNNIYLGLPVVQLAIGEAGVQAAAIYIAVTTVSFQFLSISGSEIVMQGKLSGKSVAGIVKKLAKNPLIVSCVLGIVTALARVPVHFTLDKAMSLLSSASTAVALLVLGGTLDLSSMKKIVKILSETWLDILMKLAVHPVLMYFFLLFFHVSGTLFTVTVMLSSMPSAVNCFIVARSMGMDGDYAANLVAATTTLGIISMPVWASILHMV